MNSEGYGKPSEDAGCKGWMHQVDQFASRGTRPVRPRQPQRTLDKGRCFSSKEAKQSRTTDTC